MSHEDGTARLLWAPPDPPREGEGLLGWMLREASAQHVPSLTRMLAAAANRPYLLPGSRAGGHLDPDRLADVMLSPRVVFEHLLYPDVGDGRIDFGGVSIPIWHLRNDRRRVSFSTLQAGGIHLKIWEHRFLPCCPKSFEWLTDRCPHAGCGATLRWRWMAGVQNCAACGQALSAARRTAPAAWREQLSFVADLTSSDPHDRDRALGSLPPQFAGAKPGEVLDLVHFLFPVIGAKRLDRANAVYWDRHPVRLAAALAASVDIVRGWPHALHEALNVTGVRRGAHYGAVARFLVRAQSRPGVTGRALSVVVEDMRAGRGRDACSAAGLSVPAAAAALGCAGPAVLRSRRAGHLRPSMLLRGVQLAPGLDRRDVERAAEQAREATSLHRTSELLALPGYAVDDLVTDGLLDVVDHPHLVAELSGRHVRLSSIDRRLQELRAACLARAIDDAVPLAQAMNGIGGRLKPWAAALRLIVEGSCDASWDDDGCGLPLQILLPRGSVKALRSLHAPLRDAKADPLPHGDVLEILNVTAKASSDLAALRHVRSAGRPKGRIPMAEVLRVASQRISSIEINARWGLGKARIGVDLRRLGASPRPDALGWDRAEIERLLDARPIRAAL